MKKPSITVILVIIGIYSCLGQQEESSEPPSDILRIFLDCQYGCDERYFRQEMGFVNFMQDRQRAEVFLQLVRQRTGTGGREFTMLIQGLERFKGVQDTVVFFTGPDATDNERRDAILEQIRKAVLPFILQTSVADKISYTVINDTDEPELNTAVRDPWNYWTFQFRINSFLRGESQSNFINLNNSISANRTTEESKFNFFARYNFERSEFQLEEEETSVFINKNFFTRFLYVYSLSDHWSVGGTAGAFSSTFSNVDFGYGIDPTVEYNVFPYNESARHQFTVRYNVGPSYRNYQELTVFDKLEEWYWEQELEINYSQIKDWGTLQIELEYQNYLQDFSQLRIGLNPQLEWNITKGLNLDLYTSISYISNLRNIQKSDIDPNEILVQNRQLDTSFEYFGSIGLSYRFGSAYNNIVNTRF
jgi:hypothetical protein